MKLTNCVLYCFRYSYLCIVVILIGCATIPNKPYQGPYPQSLERLSEKNQQLTEELNKLPEIKDGINTEEEKTLNKLMELYIEDPKSFDHTFVQMLKIGKPDVRKYCSPLQAFFWLIEDGKIEKAYELLNNYELTALLDYSWILANSEHIFIWKWKSKEGNLLYNNCNDSALKEKIDQFREENNNATGYTIDLAKQFPEKFDYSYNEENLDTIQSKTSLRWDNFKTVVDRLNSPELVDYYEGKNFVYSGYWSYGRYSPPTYIFKKKSGNCNDHTSFTVHCLKKAGYKASRESVSNGDHITTFYKTEEGYFVLDRAHKRTIAGKSRIRGPFKSVREIEEKYFSTGSKLISN